MMLYKRSLARHRFKKQDIFIDAMKFIIFLLTFLSFIVLFYSAIKAPKEAIMCLYLILIPAALGFLLTRTPLKLWQMLSCQAALTASPLFLLFFRPYYESFAAIFLMFIITMVSLSRRYRDHDRTSISFETLGVSSTIYAILLVLCVFFPSGNLTYVILAHALISISLFFAAHQKYAFEAGYGHIANSPTQPSGSVKRQNVVVLILLFIFSLAVIPLIVFFPYSILYSFLVTALNWIIIAILAFFNFILSLGIFPENAETDPVVENPEGIAGSTGILDMIIQYAMQIIALAVLCLLLIYALKKLIFFIIGRYRHALPNKIAFQTELIHDEVISLNKKRVKRFHRMDFGKGKEKEVRKLYYKSVKKEIRSGAFIKASQSPGEIGNAIKNSSGNDFTELTGRYELFRYGYGSDDANLKQ